MTQQSDDLFDYDVGLDEILQDTSNRPNVNAQRPSVAPETTGLGLGLDDEVKVTKKRQPVAKLDESRLLSQNGISKLRRKAQQSLKFRGKGHEFADAARLLKFYQLWLDDLYPRAKFADGLAIIERLGHSKRLQTMRKEWIDEDRPRLQTTNEELDQPSLRLLEEHGEKDAEANGNWQQPDMMFHGIVHDTKTHLKPLQQHNGTDQGLFLPDDNQAQCMVDEDAPEDDELDALLREQEGQMI